MKVRLSRHPSMVVNAVIGVVLVAGAYTVYETFSGSEDGGTAAAASERTVNVQQGTVTKTATADGTLESASTASATFATSGTVTAINVKVGDKVKKGQTLAKVDPAAAQRSLDAAEADLDAAQDAVDRAEAASSDTTEAENQVTAAELAVDEAEAGVAGTVLTAPMAGTVTAVSGTLGGSASGSSSSSSSSGGGSSTGGGSTSSSSSSSSSGFIEIADLTKMQVSASFAEADATSLKEKQVATVTWNALSGVEQSAKVAAIDPSATTSNSVVTYGVTLTLDKVPTGAKVGQTVSVSVTTGSKENVVLVNAAALTTVGNRHTVTVVANNVQETRSVEIGLEGDSATEITSGLTAGEQVVVKTTSTSTSGSQQGGFGGLSGGGGFSGGGGVPGGGGAPGGGGGR
ncbi:efflux RND transporter periplasmic adaptor subunit [Actinoplanes derwentensis]|uniref:Membrane fusion protein, macrolide-specific efflux system n=1 Tax=Actinoplanes derwentensis TaxID=113562 RepID=A0A1H1QU93_9ACTN|nr:biotin/lipoyl-binding protein [Actinoplanes derwentensis]GID89330.1 RND transporter [Actinoplanes derwentensis]SDS26936.1 membrane fusion protein, macrolide-specific efflux system [Actinoplanes derwentensis]